MHQGAVYAYFESGVVAVSNREGGLFLLEPQLPMAVYMPLMMNGLGTDWRNFLMEVQNLTR
jgi:hypothetical protein